jgi:hypothetical protein
MFTEITMQSIVEKLSLKNKDAFTLESKENSLTHYRQNNIQ